MYWLFKDTSKYRSNFSEMTDMLKICATLLEFSRNCTKLTMLSILYYFVVKGKLISARKFAPSGIRTPAT